jgi:hypothetical protein
LIHKTVFLRERHAFGGDGCVFQVKRVLTQNRALLNGGLIAEAAAKAVDVGKEVALYLCVMGWKGVCVVIGTTDHLKENFEEYRKWQGWVDDAANKANWKRYMT